MMMIENQRHIISELYKSNNTINQYYIYVPVNLRNGLKYLFNANSIAFTFLYCSRIVSRRNIHNVIKAVFEYTVYIIKHTLYVNIYLRLPTTQSPIHKNIVSSKVKNVLENMIYEKGNLGNHIAFNISVTNAY